MSQTVSKIVDGTIAQGLANKFPNGLEVFKEGSDYYTYTDTAAAKLTSSDYTNITISQTVIDSTSPVTPLRKMFPR